MKTTIKNILTWYEIQKRYLKKNYSLELKEKLQNQYQQKLDYIRSIDKEFDFEELPKDFNNIGSSLWFKKDGSFRIFILQLDGDPFASMLIPLMRNAYRNLTPLDLVGVQPMTQPTGFAYSTLSNIFSGTPHTTNRENNISSNINAGLIYAPYIPIQVAYAGHNSNFLNSF